MVGMAGFEPEVPPPPKVGTPGKKSGKAGIVPFRGLPPKVGSPGKTPVETGKEILALVWHRLGDPEWAGAFRRLLALSADDIAWLLTTFEKREIRSGDSA